MNEKQEEEKKGLLIPEWMRDLAFKVLPWLITGLIGASIGLFVDNIGNKRDIAREVWRSDQQDARLSRFEAKQDRIEERISQTQGDLNDFKEEVREEVIKRLDMLIEKRERRNR